MTTLAELYNKVRNQTDTQPGELPDALLNDYLHEAFNRTIAAENMWPFYEQVWDITLPAGERLIDLTGLGVNEPTITALFDVENQFRLTQMDLEKATDYYQTKVSPVTSFGPTVYALWAGEIIFYPISNFEEDKAYRLVGYRYPVAWTNLTDSDAPDCDERLHLALAHYATALSYAREEDVNMERNYMERWQRDVEIARTAIMEANRQRPLIMGPRFVSPIGPWPIRTAYGPAGGVTINTP